jgi:hypothetical protein
MFQPNTLFVIGAGASAEVGLPLGKGLAQQTSKLLAFKFEFGRLIEGNQNFFERMTKSLSDKNAIDKYLKAAAQIADGVCRVKSIDRYIDTHQHNEQVIACSKTAIVYSILCAERASLLYADVPARGEAYFSNLDKTWFTEFGSMLVEGVPLSKVDLIFKDIKIICFNYDRCIEEFLAYWLSSVYAVELSRSRDIVKTLRILRPYGGIGPLPSNDTNGIAFGDNEFTGNIFDISANIKTFSEQVEEGMLLHDINTAVEEAETIIFLGFGFIRENIELITKYVKEPKTKMICASALRESPQNAGVIQDVLLECLKRPSCRHPNIVNTTCQELLTTYRRPITTKFN